MVCHWIIRVSVCVCMRERERERVCGGWGGGCVFHHHKGHKTNKRINVVGAISQAYFPPAWFPKRMKPGCGIYFSTTKKEGKKQSSNVCLRNSKILHVLQNVIFNPFLQCVEWYSNLTFKMRINLCSGQIQIFEGKSIKIQTKIIYFLCLFPNRQIRQKGTNAGAQ